MRRGFLDLRRGWVGWAISAEIEVCVLQEMSFRDYEL